MDLRGQARAADLPHERVEALEDYVPERTTGPLFLNAQGAERLSYSIAYKLIRRLARRAGIAAADKISPYSLRHSFATELLGAGVPLQDVQDAMGHADPRTTRAYDRTCDLGWSWRLAPTPGRSTLTSIPRARRCCPGPTPESRSSC